MARILVADDEEGVRSFIAEALEVEGHAVTTAADGEEAARLLSKQGVDLLVTDLRMPGMDGLTLLRKVREEQPDVEVVVLTAVGSVESAVSAMKAGAFEYLLKPVGSPAELRLTVARALERRALLNLKTEVRQSTSEVVLSWGAPTMGPVVEALRKVAPTQATVLLVGESGTGKEVAARALHQWSERSEGPFVAVNCAALTETLLESELFGHEKGAFTGAVAQRRGRIELAQGGTFFLDEVGELKAELQAKLLRVLQERRFERVGGTRTLEADVRWVAATNRDLKTMMAHGEFREDLYHRLAVFPIRLPSLRERREDLRPLSELLLRRIGEELGRPGLKLSPESSERLESFSWPGNVRELRNALERAAILADGAVVESRHLWLDPTSAPTSTPAPAMGARLPDKTLEELERMAIEQAIADEGGNRKRAAQRLGIGLRTLYDKLRRYGMQ
ncbi:sigma-54 dependent transcriptional regulator [Myxococcus sp. K38C18041901]|uniref:sigma-54-dependent transcriptional regulator n=1 Tax=Myxococcus guangdongensis TaxID=2906760 RepID=UPI0020A6FF70|nr:sigma-54 dependent transcriptional regulator [Myxococcus guangdongensis]MCP3064279.1 sigma-54 dependent transcriptional regulator [Myxococcus guangdongensis]